MRKLTLLSLILLSPIACQSAWGSPASDEAEVGNSLARQGCYDSALMFYDKALRLSPNYAPAIDARNRVLGLMGKAGAGKKGKKKGDQAADTADTAKAKPEKLVSPVAKIKPPEKVKPTVAVTPPVKPAPKPKPPVVAAVKPPPAPAKPAVKPVTPPKPTTVVATVKPLPPLKPVIKPIARPAQPVAAATVKPVTAMVSPLKPIVPTPAVPISVVKQKTPPPEQKPIEPVKTEPEDDQVAPVSEDTTHRSTAPVEDLQSVPPTSGDSSFSDTIDSRAPSWLFYMAGGTFLLLLALGVWWLSPTLSASRQLHDRLKGLEQRKER